MKTLNEKLEFVFMRGARNGIRQFAPIMAIGWINYLRTIPGQAPKQYSIEQVIAAFRRLGDKRLIRTVRRGESAFLDLWELTNLAGSRECK